ncbi:hypothetical protein [Burkholderia aenigmatica]|uniref:Uncharacterized protein n=1 Tax=Burkholderia aenigmatica TaxID=2015348 RepID=A0A228I2U7_9BURK|nr:hypothetical protein [Burkholderia aenigmatica]OXI36738.1 hypothetical protein CFB84_32560 [Burkholderia aenigmatica]OXI45917.1 hypothetical protein CFB84_13860 [Burkholderia aenigmatica]
MRKRTWKSLHATSLSEAFELCVEYAAERRRPAKVLADLMGVELKTMYRWLADTSMPLNRVRQFEEFCGARFISEYLCIADGRRIVIEIPTGRRPGVVDLASLQAAFAEAAAVLCRYYASGREQAEASTALTHAMAHAGYHRENVMKDRAPELLFESEAD